MVGDAEYGGIRGVGLDEVHVDDLVECRVGIRFVLDLARLQDWWKGRLLSVSCLEIVFDHGIPQPVQSFNLSGAQGGLRGKIPIERKSGVCGRRSELLRLAARSDIQSLAW